MIGKTLGHYQLTSPLGKGGMGEVYVADDLNLNRRVALKFLPDAFSGDPERMARFEREARLLASLNHPNIAAIYGLEQADGKRFIAMELVEGETLAQRIGNGALPVEESLAICRQVSEGLEAAHEKGVVHRDLKPANVMITEGDKVKILDFGLAKALSDETQTVDSSQSPTLTEAMTRPGLILGTAAYMSPEQAKGKSVDKRADIWAFGCILYECLTGKRAFEGETVTETLASVLKNEPEWDRIPGKARFLLRSCLQKDPKQRLADISDSRLLLEQAPVSAPVNRPWLAWSVGILAVLIAAALGFLYWHARLSPQPELMHLQVAPGANLGAGIFAVSPDGRKLAFAGTNEKGAASLWIRSFNSPEARSLPGTDTISSIFWSPDNRFIAYWDGAELMKMDVSGGPPQPLCEVDGWFAGGSWNGEGTIIFSENYGQGVKQITAAGGNSSLITRISHERQETGHTYPAFLRDGRHFVYLRQSKKPENDGVYVGSLDAKPEEQSVKRLMPAASAVAYAPLPQSGGGGTVALFARRNLNGSAIRRAAAGVGRRSRRISGQRRIDRAAGLVFCLDEWSTGLWKRRQPIDAAYLV